MKEEKEVFKLSPSSLSLMEECPRCFWLTKHGIWKRPEVIFPSLPGGMDRILKKHFDKFMAMKIMPPELRENVECSGCRLFGNIELLKQWRNERKGLVWRDHEGNILHGAIDNLLVKGNKLIVLDYKTRASAAKEETAGYYKNQLDIYNFLLRKNGYETEDYSFLLFYFPKEVLDTGEVVFDTQLVKMQVSIENAERLFNKALKLLRGPCPSPKEGCAWCKLQNVHV
ncbi:MAG: PD-(D/E)XK nuclease family protein [Candidatus Pacearchaeota archaeon]|nr:PD-(D/E)XK nuclease family protein [Candidatus Pacearchaeota archaeon]